MSKFKLLFDRSFAKSYSKQILWLLGIMIVAFVVVLLLGLIPAFYQSGQDSDSRGLFFDVLFLMFDPGSMSGNMSSPYVTLVALVGIIVFCGLFISVITNMLERRVEMFETGQLRYKLQNHIVVIGYNRLAIPLIKQLCKDEPAAHILLQTSADIAAVRSGLDTDLSEDEDKHLIVYAGQQTLKEDLMQLQIDKCKCIYVLGEENISAHDSLNMDSVNLLAEIMDAQHSTLKVKCYVLFNDFNIFSSFYYADIREDVKKHIHFLPFNFEDIWSQKLLVYNQTGTAIDAQGIGVDSRKHVHVVINDITPMGMALALQTAKVAHFPNVNLADIDTLTHITFIDADAHSKMEYFRNRYPALSQLSYSRFWKASGGEDTGWSNPVESLADYKYLAPNFLDVKWEFVEGNISDVAVRDYLVESASDDSAYLTLMLCRDNADANLTDGIQLPHEVYESENVLQIFVQQDASSSIVDMVRLAANTKYHKIVPFGQYPDFFTTELVPEGFGKMVNARYCGITDMADTQHIDEEWAKTSIANKWSSICSANMRYMRLRSLGIKGNAPSNLQELIENNIKQMMDVEHNRWNMEKLLGGFRQLTEAESMLARTDKAEKKRLKNSPYFAHLDICSMEMLGVVAPQDIEYDAMVIRALPAMLAQE